MVGESLRQRKIFKFSEDPASEELDENRILDDQEQEELIRTLQDQNAESNQKLLIVLQATLALSGLLHIIYLFAPSRESPLLPIFPHNHPDPPFPLGTLFIFLALLVHLNLAALLHTERLGRIASNNIWLIPHSVSYFLSALPPCICIILAKPWQTTLWWSFTVAVVFVVQAVQRSIALSNTALLELESLKYLARGA